MNASLYIALDVVSALLTLSIAAFFATTWRTTRKPLHLLLAVGFVLVGASRPFVAISRGEVAGLSPELASVRILAHSAGALVLALSYLGLHRYGSPRPILVLGWTAVLGVVLALVTSLLAPALGEPRVPATWVAVIDVGGMIAYVVCAALSTSGFRRHPTLDRALVPAAFLAWGASSYTWLLLDLGGTDFLVPFAYVWRFVGLSLLLVAIRPPFKREAREG